MHNADLTMWPFSTDRDIFVFTISPSNNSCILGAFEPLLRAVHLKDSPKMSKIIKRLIDMLHNIELQATSYKDGAFFSLSLSLNS